MPVQDIVYTDGACKGNPGPGGWATLMNNTLYCGGMPYTTNNAMEAYAILAAVGEADKGASLQIRTDSRLCIGWYADNWKCKNPVIKGYIKRFREICRDDNITVEFRWVKGHHLDVYNDIVDRAAVRESRRIAYFDENNALAEFLQSTGAAM